MNSNNSSASGLPDLDSYKGTEFIEKNGLYNGSVIYHGTNLTIKIFHLRGDFIKCTKMIADPHSLSFSSLTRISHSFKLKNVLLGK